MPRGASPAATGERRRELTTNGSSSEPGGIEVITRCHEPHCLAGGRCIDMPWICHCQSPLPDEDTVCWNRVLRFQVHLPSPAGHAVPGTPWALHVKQELTHDVTWALRGCGAGRRKFRVRWTEYFRLYPKTHAVWETDDDEQSQDAGWCEAACELVTDVSSVLSVVQVMLSDGDDPELDYFCTEASTSESAPEDYTLKEAGGRRDAATVTEWPAPHFRPCTYAYREHVDHCPSSGGGLYDPRPRGEDGVGTPGGQDPPSGPLTPGAGELRTEPGGFVDRYREQVTYFGSVRSVIAHPLAPSPAAVVLASAAMFSGALRNERPRRRRG